MTLHADAAHPDLATVGTQPTGTTWPPNLISRSAAPASGHQEPVGPDDLVALFERSDRTGELSTGIAIRRWCRTLLDVAALAVDQARRFEQALNTGAHI